MNIYEIQMYMAIGMFILGAITFGIGVIVLVSRTLSKDLRNLEAQTTSLAQKGIAEEISGLVGNASNLLNAMNEMVLTARGIGIFLTLIGIILMGVAIFFVLQIH